MDNNHIANKNNSIQHSINEIGDRLNTLSVNDSRLNNSSRSLPSNYNDMSLNPLSSRSNSQPNSVTSSQTISKLNPTAQEFVPRQHQARSGTMTGQHTHHHLQPQHHAPIQNNNNNNHHHFSNGGGNLLDNENYIEDYMSLSYLKDFINHISNKPSMYDQGINELTLIINSYLDEDDCVLELIVNQIVDQSIIDGNFLYNGVRLCYHFMENLRETNSGQSFKQLLFKRNQRECSRKVTGYSSANTFIHLRGLALFTAELYARCQESELVEHLPSLLMNLLSPDVLSDENVKCVCDVLKLCGQQLENYFEKKGKSDFKKMVERLKEISNNDNSTIPAKHIKEMVKKILTLIENKWVHPQTQTVQSKLNPYLNNNNPGMNDAHFEIVDPNCGYGLYDFGNCGDENNDEVCKDFEKFLKNTHQQF